MLNAMAHRPVGWKTISGDLNTIFKTKKLLVFFINDLSLQYSDAKNRIPKELIHIYPDLYYRSRIETRSVDWSLHRYLLQLLHRITM